MWNKAKGAYESVKEGTKGAYESVKEGTKGAYESVKEGLGIQAQERSSNAQVLYT